MASAEGIQETCFAFNEIEPYEEKHEFKVGDKVRVNLPKDIVTKYLILGNYQGKVATIINVEGSYAKVKAEGLQPYFFDIDYLIPYEETKHKFKVGDTVKLSDNFYHKEYRNKIGVVTDVSGTYITVDMGDNCVGGQIFDDLELVNEEKHEFKPFDKVLVRNANYYWCPRLYEKYSKEDGRYYCQDRCGYTQCIPFAGHEHLVGTTNNPY